MARLDRQSDSESTKARRISGGLFLSVALRRESRVISGRGRGMIKAIYFIKRKPGHGARGLPQILARGARRAGAQGSRPREVCAIAHDGCRISQTRADLRWHRGAVVREPRRYAQDRRHAHQPRDARRQREVPRHVEVRLHPDEGARAEGKSRRGRHAEDGGVPEKASRAFGRAVSGTLEFCRMANSARRCRARDAMCNRIR